MAPENLKEAARLFLQVRRTRRWLPSLPEYCRPSDVADAYEIQRLVFAELGGAAAAWKVGAGSPDATPACAQIAAATTFDDGAALPASMFNLAGAEAEIAYRLGRDLPLRSEPYSLEEVKASIESVRPTIEISDTRFVAWASQDRPSHLADQLNHGALVVGADSARLTEVEASQQRAIMKVNGEVRADRIGGNPAGDPLRLLVWLANNGSRGAGGLRAGEVVTTGSLIGVIFVTTPAVLVAELPGLGSVHAAIG